MSAQMSHAAFSLKIPGFGWIDGGPVPEAGPNARRYRRGHLLVVSSLDVAEYPDGSGEKGPQWHVSVSFKGGRAKPNLVRLALRDFGMLGAEEDNHHPGNARHFWRPCDPVRRVDCECKATEDVIVDPDGYTWTNPTENSGEICRGCEWAASALGQGDPCPIHGGAR